MFVIDGQFNALTILGVGGETALKGDSIVVLIGLAGKNEVLLCGQLAVKAVHAEVDAMCTLLHRREQQLRLAYRHRVDRTDRFFTLHTKHDYLNNNRSLV